MARFGELYNKGKMAKRSKKIKANFTTDKIFEQTT